MIRKILFLVPICVALVFTACKDDEVAKVFSISPQDITFDAIGDTTYVSVYGDQENWKMWIGEQNKDTWCSFNTTFTEFTKSGKGRTETIPLYSKPNPNRFKLRDTLYLEDLTGKYGIIKVKLTLSGIGIVFNVQNSDTLRYIKEVAGDVKVKLNTNVDNFNFIDLPSNVRESYNSADSTITLSFDANSSAIPLITDIKIVGSWAEPKKDLTINMQFIQDGITSSRSDSLILADLNNRYSLGWDLSAPMKTWKGVAVGPTENSTGIVHRVIGLDLSNKNLSGVLPVEVAQLAYLNSLRLNNNKFTGSIPNEYYDLIYLETLWLGSNDLTGMVDNNKISNLMNLQNLSIINTSINGEIPANLSMLKKLTSLQLSGNMFTGNLPEALGNSKILRTFTVNGNDLSGTIPQSYRKNIFWYDWSPEKNIIPQRNGNLK